MLTPSSLVAGLLLAHLQIADRVQTPRIEADFSQMTKLSALTREYQRLAVRWYPKIVKLLGAENYVTDRPVKIVMDESYDGVAATENNTIHVSPKYAIAHPSDIGLIVHELTHVVQGYPENADDPGWLIEGIADYVRWFNYEPISKHPHPDAAHADARAAYRTTAAFLDWVIRQGHPDLVVKLNATLHAGTYHDTIFKELTGTSLDDLAASWKASLASK